MIEMPEGEPSAEEVNAQVLRALRTTGIVNAREDVVEGLDQGFLGRSDVVPLERKKDGSFSARSSGRDGFSGGIGICGAENPAGGTTDFGWKNRIGPV